MTIHTKASNGQVTTGLLANGHSRPAAQPTQAAEARIKRQAQVDNATLLHASRRLDWRFLLPNPTLARVAYFGQANGSILSSLALFADELTIVAEDKGPQNARYDVVVAYEPTPRRLRQAVDALEPGGALYLEAHGLFWPAKWQRGKQALALLQQPRLWQPNDYMTVLNRWGLAEAEAFWVWPNFESCTKMVPLNEPVVLAHAFAAQARSTRLKARLKAAYKQWLIRSGWLTLTMPSFGIVAH